MREGADYLVYAIKRWGWAKGLWLWFRWYGSPHLIPYYIRESYRQWRLIDRRKKIPYSHTVYVVNRDGDLYLVECPRCHNTQTVIAYRCHRSIPMGDGISDPCFSCGKKDRTHFHCFHCYSNFGWDVYLEDGLIECKDHRKGNPPNPCTVVRDDNKIYRLGIDKDAPWWWKRLSVWRDLNPENGKDAHGHHPYEVWDIDPEFMKQRNRDNCIEEDCVPKTYIRQPGDPIDPAAEKVQTENG